MNRNRRVLFVCARHPFPPWRGDQVRTYNLARHLADRADVRIVCFAGGPRAFDGVPVRLVEHSLAGRLAANLRHPSPGLPFQVRAFLDERMRRAVNDELASWRPDVLHITLSRMAPYMASSTAAHRHLDLVDSMGLNMRARAGASGIAMRAFFTQEARLVGRYEARMAARADSVSVVAELDRTQQGLEGATVIPNGVDAEAFPYRDPEDRPPVVVFFGNLGYFPNAQPAAFLATQVLGRVREDHAEALLRVAGARPGPAVRRLAQLPGVELIADPPAMAPMLHGAAVAAIPMFSGSGMKNKVLEAFCAGTPVVANAAGIEGIENVEPGRDFVLAEGPEATSKAISALLADPGERVRLARAARAIVDRHYSWRRQADRMMAAYGLDPE